MSNQVERVYKLEMLVFNKDQRIKELEKELTALKTPHPCEECKHYERLTNLSGTAQLRRLTSAISKHLGSADTSKRKAQDDHSTNT